MPVSTNTGLQPGDKVEYNGRIATVELYSPTKHTITIECNGEKITVDANDIHGRNSNITSNSSDYYTSRINEYDERIAENNETIKKKKRIWSFATKAKRKVAEKIHSLLRSIGVINGTQIKDQKEMAEYQSYVNEKNGYRLMQLRASADIQSTCLDSLSACTSKKYLTGSQMVAEHMSYNA